MKYATLSAMKTDYDNLLKNLPDPHFVFLNYGLAEADPAVSSWIRQDDLPYRYHLSLVRRVMGKTPTSEKQVLEIGSGRGGNCAYLAGYGEARRVWGMDRSVAHARFSRERHGTERTEFLVGDAERLPFSDRSFDVVLNLESAHCYGDFGSFLSEVHRVLRPEGIFCFADVWDWDGLSIDWRHREIQLRNSPMTLQSGEDITRDVLRSLQQPDGMAATLPLISGKQSAVARTIIKGARGVRDLLASGKCTYRIERFRKLEANHADCHSL